MTRGQTSMLDVECSMLNVSWNYFTGYCQTQSPFRQPIRLWRNLAAVVRFIPADGVEQKFPILRAAIMQRLAADDVVRKFFHELRNECVELFGIFAVRELVTFQRAGDLRFVYERLIVRSRLDCLGKVGNANGRQHSKE